MPEYDPVTRVRCVSGADKVESATVTLCVVCDGSENARICSRHLMRDVWEGSAHTISTIGDNIISPMVLFNRP